MGRGTGGERRAGLRVLCLLSLCAALSAIAISGCGDGSSGDDAAAARRRAAAAVAAREHALEMKLGARVFAKHCQSCHTLAGKPYTGRVIEFEAPNLDEVKLKRHYVRYRVDMGGPAMASFAQAISPEGQRAVITYVTEAAGRDVEDDGQQSPDVLAEGRELFAANCAACHAIEGRAMTGRPFWVGTDFTLVRPSVRFVKERMRTGVMPEDPMMPSFRGKLDADAFDAIARYVNAVAGEGPEAPPTPEMAME